MIDMPSKMTPELISTVESFSDLPKVPFYISDYLDDAVDRLRAVAPISVRDRKKVIHLFEDPAIDPRDDEIFYTSFLDFIEKEPAGIMSITATLSAGIAQRKVLKLPGWRFWDAVGQPDVWQEIQTNYLLAPDGADGKGALFRLFMLYCVTQAATAHLRETGFPAAKMPTEDGNLLEQIFPEETYQACDDDDGPMSAVSITREDEWREQCRQIEAVAAAMREELDANRIGEIYDLLESLEAMTEPEQEDVPVRAACMSALSSVFDDQEVAALSPKLDGLDAEALKKIIHDVAVLRVAFHEWRITETRRADLGAAMDTAVAAQQWIETSRLSQELPISDAELARTLALRDAALRMITECLGNIRLREDLSDGVACEADPVQGADEPVVPLIVDTALLDDVRSQLEVQPEGETDEPEVETEAESCKLTPLPVAPEPDSPQAALGDEAVGGARTPSSDPGVDGDLLAARSDLVIPAETSSDPTVQGIHADIGQPAASPSIDVDDASVSQRIAELIAKGQIAIAARFAGALEECGVVPPIESEVLRVVAASRTSFEGYDSNAQDFATMANSAGYDGHPDAGRITEYRGALLLAALLRPSVLLPDLQTRQIVSDLNLKSYGPALSELQDEISKLDYSFSPSLQDLAKNSGRPQVSRLQAVVQEIEQWHEQALVRRGPCQPSTKVMNIIVTTREVGLAVKAVIDRQPDAAAMVQVAIERYADRESILLRAGEINRGSGTRSKGFLPQISLNFMHRNISEGIDLLVRWRDISQREGRRGSGSLDHLPRPVSALRAKTKAALVALQPVDDPLDTAVASWISSQLEAFDQMLTGQYPEQFMTLDAALSDELDLLPAGCQPASPYHLRGAAVGAQHLSDSSMRETQAVIHSVLDGRIATPKSSFDEKLLSGAYVAASRLVARVHSDPAERGRLVNQIEVSRKTRLDALDAQTEHLSGVLKDLVKIDLKFQDDIARELVL